MLTRNFQTLAEANLLFVEFPIGVGFSYTNTSSDLTILEDSFVAEDTYNFLVNWLERFPHFKSRDFYIAGESYAGHYIPQVAELVFDRNKDRNNKYPFINLKGFIAGNPETEDYYDNKGLLEYAWSHAVISDQQYNKAKKVENDYSVGRMRIFGGYDPYGRVPVIGTRYWIETLGLPLKSTWHSWYHNNQVGGRIVEYEGLTYVTVRGAGHLVPLNKPSEALSLFHSFLTGDHLPHKV
ncbi:hypothetical protein TanjilG_07434 [Lupinus angustifolius]|uniref:Carboxypeptidase n=1 Tax=Lupinus angustifolius TaxID=3871 RepID=A0A4P1QV40_LUPAN|nr:hypothetical protein TanjilG_07434 [Lupinus angustifolius]